MGLSFESYSIWLNFLIFAVAAAIIWYAGTKLERYADAISEATDLGHAFIGLLLLSVATSLPELATTITATLSGNIALAVSNIVGGVVAQTAILAVADAFVGKGALTRFSPRFVLLIDGVGLILLLAIVPMAVVMDKIAAVTVSTAGGDYRIALIPAALLIIYLLMMYLTQKYEAYPRWRPADDTDDDRATLNPQGPDRPRNFPQAGLYQLAAYFGAFALLVLAAGWIVTRTAEALAVQTGLGASFIGATLLAVSTSLPELSTTITAARRGNYSLAVSNIFGSNAVDVTLIFLISLLSGGQYIFQDVEAFTMFASTLGIFMTGVYLWGMLEWEDRSFLRMGWDSTAVLVLYIIGMVALYRLS